MGTQRERVLLLASHENFLRFTSYHDSYWSPESYQVVAQRHQLLCRQTLSYDAVERLTDQPGWYFPQATAITSLHSPARRKLEDHVLSARLGT